MKIVSWNVNGVRAAYKKGLDGFVRSYDPTILCLQETKAHPDQVGPEVIGLGGRKSFWAWAEKKGYSGVATFVAKEPVAVTVGLGVEAFDREGRVVITDHGDFLLYNVYFPNGQKGQERVDYKLTFHQALQAHALGQVKSGREVIVVGDYNVAPAEIDIYDPKKFSSTSGFLPQERDWYAEFLSAGFVDTFRHFYPLETERYSWWNQIDRSRLSNRGWRIDMICVSAGLKNRLKSADILDQVEGSDHCPVVVELV